MLSWWIAAALMSLLVVIALLGFLRRQAQAQHSEKQAEPENPGLSARDSDNLLIYQQRTEELDRLLANQAIDSPTHSALLLEARQQLDSELSEQAVAASDTQRPASGFDRWLVVAVALLIPLLALALYLPQGMSLGGQLDLQVADQLKRLNNVTTERERQQSLLALADYLDARVSPRSKRVDLLRLQAEIYSGTSRHGRASAVYRNLLDRNPEDANIMAALAQSLYLKDNSPATANSGAQSNAANNSATGPMFSNEVDGLLAKALTINPQQYLALSLSGMRAFTLRDFANAITYWEQALEQYGEGSAQTASLQAGIEAARSQLKTGESAIALAEQSDPASAFIRLTIAIDPAQRRADDSANTPVFVFARAVNGPRMPLAAKRLTLADLPVEIVLTEQDKMASQSIAGHSEVIVAARLARSGQPIATSGDSQSNEFTVAVAASAASAKPVELLIDRQKQ